MRRFKPILAGLLLSALAAAAPHSTTRLATAAKLCARIHYTHPWLAAKEIDWTRAFAEAAPKILAAHSMVGPQAGRTRQLHPLRKQIGDRRAAIGNRYRPISGIQVFMRVNPERAVNGGVEVRHRNRTIHHLLADLVGPPNHLPRL